jgi:tRNA A-37 threonylcarbamoyl transferase component Bud32
MLKADYAPEREQRLQSILVAYLDAEQPPSRDELLARYPELAAELAEFLDNRARLEQLAAPLRPPMPPSLSTAATLGPGEAPVIAPSTTVRYFGDYELLEERARGGMGVVYKARQVSLDRVVAVKMILAGQLAGEADVQRFRQEAQTAARLQHPGIVALHEVGEHDGQHFFSMDYIDGQSLAELVRDHPLPAKQAIRYVRLIAEAVQFAHEQGVLHRDLKPGNVLIDRFDQPRVTDFGLAKNIAKDAGLTATGAVVGTPSYMPPEQASGQRGKVGPTADVYALGAVLYELVTGRPPFQAATPLHTLLQVLEAEPVAPGLLVPGISRDLETVILKCLHKEPGKRYASAAELADDLGALLEGRPIKARPPSLAERVGTWFARQGRTFRIALGTAGGAVVVLLAVLLLLDWRHQARLGKVMVETEALARVEVFHEEDDRVVASFTAPTQQPLRLAEGNYRVRLSAPYELSETSPLLVERGQTARRRADLSKRRLGGALPSPGVFEVAPAERGHDVLTVVSPDTLARYYGANGQLRWSVTLGPDDRPRLPGAGRDEKKRSEFFGGPFQLGPMGQPLGGPRLLQPCRDLDGDGCPDLVWQSTGGSLLALSGKNGKFLWHFRPTLRPWPGQGRPRPAKYGPSLHGRAVLWAGADKGDRPLVLAIFEQRAPDARWAEAIDARTGRPIWHHNFENESLPLRGPWVVKVGGRSVLVCMNGSRLIGLEPGTGKATWGPVDLNFEPDGPPAFAELVADGRIGMVVRDANRTVRAVTVPGGKVLWEHALPGNQGWVATHTWPPYLLEPLVIDLDGDGKPEVIVPAEKGTIALLDGATGRVRWRSTVAINWGEPSAARVLVGPDLDGDGCRDVFVAGSVYISPHDARSLVRVQALSGKTGRALWRCHFHYPSPEMAREDGMPLLTWQRGEDGWPLLVVPGTHETLVLAGGSGRVVHLIPRLRGPYRAIDLDGDGVLDLIGYQLPRGGWGSSPGHLHCFRGALEKAGDAEPITPREEAVEWVPLPWLEKVRGRSDGTDHTLFLVMPLVFLGYVGLRVLGMGWSGLWRPVLAYLGLVLGLMTLSLGNAEKRQPWQRYEWDGWYWILVFGLLYAGIATLLGLGAVVVYRVCRRLFGLVFRVRE